MSRAAETLVRRWVRIYTIGIEKEARFRRRAEIDSDLWEHRVYAAAENFGHASLSILGRWAAGIPSDLSWRATQHRRTRTTKEPMMSDIVGRYWWQALAALTLLGTAYIGIDQFFADDVSSRIDSGKVFALVLFVGAGILIGAGLGIYRTAPRRGAGLVVIGVLPLALIGGLGVGGLVALIASLIGNQDWWWVPVGLASAIATAAGLGAFSAWWHAAPSTVPARRLLVLPVSLVLGGLIAGSLGAGFGLATLPLVGLGAITVLLGVVIWSRRFKLSR